MKNHIDFKVFKGISHRGVYPWNPINEMRSYATVFLESHDNGNSVPIFYQAVFTIDVLRNQSFGYIINVDENYNIVIDGCNLKITSIPKTIDDHHNHIKKILKKIERFDLLKVRHLMTEREIKEINYYSKND